MDHVEELALEAQQLAKSANKRLDSLEPKVDDIHDLAKSMAGMKVKVDNLTADIGEIKNEVKKVVDKPGDMWSKLITAIMTAIASGLAGIFIASIFK